MDLKKYTFFTTTGELREETLEVLEERDDRYWVQDYMGARIVSKSEINKAINNPLYESIRVYTTGEKEQAVEIILKEYWKHVDQVDKEYATQKEKMVKNLSILGEHLYEKPMSRTEVIER